MNNLSLTVLMKNIATYGSSNVIVQVSNFLVFIITVHKFAPNDYAFLVLLTSLIPISKNISALEISQSVCYMYADCKIKLYQQVYFSVGFYFTAIINLCFLLLGLSLFFLSFNSTHQTKEIILFAGIAFYFDSLWYYCLVILRWQSRVLLYSAINILSALVKLGVVVINLYFLGMGLSGVTLAWTCAWLLSFLISVFFVKDLFLLYFSFRALKKLLGLSFPLFLNNIPNYLLSVLDKYIVLFFLGTSDLGIYGSLKSLASPFGAVIGVIETSVWPTIYQSAKSGKTNVKIGLLSELAIGGSCTALFLATLLSPTLVEKILPTSYANTFSSKLLFVIFAAISALRLIRVFSPGIFIAKKTKILLSITCFSLAFNIIFCTLASIFFGLTGTAVAQLITSLASLLLFYYFGQKFFYVAINKMRVILILALFTVFELIAYSILPIYT